MKNVFQQLEKAFLFSPIFLVLISIFNFTDTKYLVSRVSVVVILYSIIRYRQCIKNNFSQYNYKAFFLSSILVFIYFSIMHIWRGDNFGLPRTLITCLIYLTVIPWCKFSRVWVYNTIILSAFVCGFNAIYEYYYLNYNRVGMAINPIPYALYCSFLSLSSLALMTSYDSRFMKSACVVGFLLSLCALILTDSRGVWVAYPLVLAYVLNKMFNHLPVIKLSIGLFFGIAVAYCTFKPTIDSRFALTVAEYKSIKNGNYKTSVGARLELWEYGIKAWKDKAIWLGLGDERLEEGIKTIPNKVAYRQPHLHNQYIDVISRYGLIGLILICSWFICAMFLKSVREGKVITYALLFLTFISGLSDVPLHHSHIVYLLMLIVGSFTLIRK